MPDTARDLLTPSLQDLRCYVLTGKTFPRTTAEFSAKMPKPGCSQLTNCDPDIYQKTMDTIVTIGSSCYAYHQSNLAKLVTAATTAAQFSDTTISMMVDADMGLRPSLNVMLDPKYRTVASQDDAFSDARELAVMVLTDLKTDANEKEAEIKEIVETMISVCTYPPTQLYIVRFALVTPICKLTVVNPRHPIV